MYHVSSRNQHLPSVIRSSELIVKILGKSDNNPDYLDIWCGSRYRRRREARCGEDIFGHGPMRRIRPARNCGCFSFRRFRLEKSDGRLGHRAPGRGGRRASIPLPALATLLSALGAFGLCEFRVSQQISTFYGPSVQTMETRLGARQRRRAPDGSPR